jgi:hypothetical protein
MHSERRLYPEADAALRGRTRARIRTNNRTPTRAPRRRSEIHVSKFGWMSIHIIYLDEWMAIEYTCTHRCAWHLSQYTHISMPVCATCPYTPTYMRTCKYMKIHNRDIDIVMYIHIIQVYRCTPVDAEPSTHARTFISTRTRTHEGMAAAERRWSRGCACACAPRHPYMPRGTSVHAHWYRWAYHSCARAHTHTRTCARSHGIDSHTHTNTCTLTYVRRCMHLVIHVSWARACAAPDARSHARTKTHTHSHGIYTHTHMHVHALKRRHTRMVTPI